MATELMMNRKPELETIRDEGLTTNVDPRKLAENLIEKLSTVHVSYIFHAEGRSALKKLCLLISSTPTSMNYSSWKDLAGALNLSVLQIGCIANNNSSMDNTELVLLVFSQNKEHTVDKLVTALEQIQRYDAILETHLDLEHLKSVAEQEQQKRVATSYHNEFSPENSADTILRPDGWKTLKSMLQITLKESESDIKPRCAVHLPEDRDKEENRLQQTSILVQPRPKKKSSRNIMLTFAKDGIHIARRVTRILRQRVDNRPPIGVLILDEHREKVKENPENFIMHWFERMNYIMPIVTPGYLDAIGTPPIIDDSLLAPLDPQYVQYIHDLISKYYRENFCRNKKIRCVVPDAERRTIFNHPHMKLDPALKVFVYEDEIESLARRIMKIFD